jgi:hypothetical protein
MSNYRERVLRLLREIEQLHRQPQAVEHEFQIACRELKIKISNCEREATIAKRVLLFLSAWRNMGRFTAIRTDGTRMDANPYQTGDPVIDFYNVKAEATRLAEWSM